MLPSTLHTGHEQRCHNCKRQLMLAGMLATRTPNSSLYSRPSTVNCVQAPLNVEYSLVLGVAPDYDHLQKSSIGLGGHAG